jgi:hypothetical protein
MATTNILQPSLHQVLTAASVLAFVPKQQKTLKVSFSLFSQIARIPNKTNHLIPFRDGAELSPCPNSAKKTQPLDRVFFEAFWAPWLLVG